MVLSARRSVLLPSAAGVALLLLCCSSRLAGALREISNNVNNHRRWHETAAGLHSSLRNKNGGIRVPLLEEEVEEETGLDDDIVRNVLVQKTKEKLCQISQERQQQRIISQEALTVRGGSRAVASLNDNDVDDEDTLSNSSSSQEKGSSRHSTRNNGNVNTNPGVSRTTRNRRLKLTQRQQRIQDEEQLRYNQEMDAYIDFLIDNYCSDDEEIDTIDDDGDKVDGGDEEVKEGEDESHPNGTIRKSKKRRKRRKHIQQQQQPHVELSILASSENEPPRTDAHLLKKKETEKQPTGEDLVEEQQHPSSFVIDTASTATDLNSNQQSQVLGNSTTTATQAATPIQQLQQQQQQIQETAGGGSDDENDDDNKNKDETELLDQYISFLQEDFENDQRLDQYIDFLQDDYDADQALDQYINFLLATTTATMPQTRNMQKLPPAAVLVSSSITTSTATVATTNNQAHVDDNMVLVLHDQAAKDTSASADNSSSNNLQKAIHAELDDYIDRLVTAVELDEYIDRLVGSVTLPRQQEEDDEASSSGSVVKSEQVAAATEEVATEVMNDYIDSVLSTPSARTPSSSEKETIGEEKGENTVPAAIIKEEGVVKEPEFETETEMIKEEDVEDVASESEPESELHGIVMKEDVASDPESESEPESEPETGAAAVIENGDGGEAVSVSVGHDGPGLEDGNSEEEAKDESTVTIDVDVQERIPEEPAVDEIPVGVAAADGSDDDDDGDDDGNDKSESSVKDDTLVGTEQAVVLNDFDKMKNVEEAAVKLNASTSKATTAHKKKRKKKKKSTIIPTKAEGIAAGEPTPEPVSAAAPVEEEGETPVMRSPNGLYRFLLAKGSLGHALVLALVLLVEWIQVYAPQFAELLAFLWLKAAPAGLQLRLAPQQYSAGDGRAAASSLQQMYSGRMPVKGKQRKQLSKRADEEALAQLQRIGDIQDVKYKLVSQDFMKRHGLGTYETDLTGVEEEDEIPFERKSHKKIKSHRKKAHDQDDGDSNDDDSDVEWVLQGLSSKSGAKGKPKAPSIEPKVTFGVDSDGPKVEVGFELDFGRSGKLKPSGSRISSLNRDAITRDAVRKKTSGPPPGDRDGGSGVMGRLRAAATSNSMVSRSLFGAYPADVVPPNEAADAGGVAALAQKYGYGEWSDDEDDEDDDNVGSGSVERPKESTRKRKGKKRTKRRSPIETTNPSEDEGLDVGALFADDDDGTEAPAISPTRRKKSKKSSRRDHTRGVAKICPALGLLSENEKALPLRKKRKVKKRSDPMASNIDLLKRKNQKATPILIRPALESLKETESKLNEAGDESGKS